MKNVIPFSKELDFSTKISEITSISLEREFEVKNSEIEGNLFVSGEYKSHEVSANVIPFSYKIPFTIEIPENLKKESIVLEISDFAYDIMEEKQIKVNIELELNGELEEIKENIEEVEPVPSVDSEEIIRMMEEEKEMQEVEENQIEEKKEKELPTEEAVTVDREESEDVILNTVTNEEEYQTYHIHIVKEGENIETICTMYNSNMSLLADYNDLSNVIAGEKIIVPSNDES